MVVGKDNDIVRPEITVDNPLRVRIMQGVTNLRNNADGATWRQALFLVDNFAQAASAQILHHNKGLLIGEGAAIVDGNYMRVI